MYLSICSQNKASTLLLPTKQILLTNFNNLLLLSYDICWCSYIGYMLIFPVSVAKQGSLMTIEDEQKVRAADGLAVNWHAQFRTVPEGMSMRHILTCAYIYYPCSHIPMFIMRTYICTHVCEKLHIPAARTVPPKVDIHPCTHTYMCI